VALPLTRLGICLLQTPPRFGALTATTKIITTLLASPPDSAFYAIFESPNALLVVGEQTIYRVNVLTLATTTIAGGASCSFVDSGDGGPAVNACLGGPFSVAEDSAGTSTSERTVLTASERSTLPRNTLSQRSPAGGLRRRWRVRLPARLSAFPTVGLWIPEGNGYINDSANSRIRRVDAVTKTITTVAGNGAPNAEFQVPQATVVPQ